MICDAICACAVTSTLGTISISGSGTVSDPWVFETANGVDITQMQADIANLQSAMDALPGTYVDQTGDSMTGALSITAANEALQIRRTTDGAHIGWYHTDGTRLGYIQTLIAGEMRVVATAGIDLVVWADALEKARVTTGGILLVGKQSTNIASQGVEASGTGSLFSTRADTAGGVVANKIGAGVASGTTYAEYRLSGTIIGSVTRNAATSAVLYNTSSDEQLKNVISDLDPELCEYVLGLIMPVMYSWRDDKGNTPIAGYIAQQVAKAWPQSIELGLVTPGYGDITDRTWDSDGNETTPQGVWGPWQMDKSVLIPLLHASLVRTTTKLSYLRAEFDEFKAQTEARLTKLGV